MENIKNVLYALYEKNPFLLRKLGTHYGANGKVIEGFLDALQEQKISVRHHLMEIIEVKDENVRKPENAKNIKVTIFVSDDEDNQSSHDKDLVTESVSKNEFNLLCEKFPNHFKPECLRVRIRSKY